METSRRYLPKDAMSVVCAPPFLEKNASEIPPTGGVGYCVHRILDDPNTSGRRMYHRGTKYFEVVMVIDVICETQCIYTVAGASRGGSVL